MIMLKKWVEYCAIYKISGLLTLWEGYQALNYYPVAPNSNIVKSEPVSTT